MRKYVISIIFLFLTTSISFAQNVDRYYLEGVWKKTYDFKIDGVISGKIVSNKVNFTRQGNKFIGKYIGDPGGNPSIFEGQGFSKQKNLVYVVQKHPRGSGFKYYSIMSSVMVSPNKLIGTWCDSRGNMGDLIWTRRNYAQEKPGRVLTPPERPKSKVVQHGCRTLTQVYTDGSGNSRTKKLGGNYVAIRLDSLRDDEILRVEAVSGKLMYVTLHARYQGGYWRTIYKGPKTEFPVGQYIASYKKDKNCTHVNISINGAHEKYDPVACRANLFVCGTPDKPRPKKIAEDNKKMLANLSLKKPARQSSTGYGGTAQLAVDGNTDGNYLSGSTTHTNDEKNPWWEVDLGAAYKLENVLVYNRIDACSERLDNFQVLVSVEPFPNSPVTANGYTIKGWTVQKAQNINRINLGKTHGRYVRIQLLGQNYLSLAEVIVNGVSTETHPTGTAMTGELSNAQKKVLVLEQLYKEAYQDYQGLLKIRGSKDSATQGAFTRYMLLVKIYNQVKQEYVQSNQGRDDLYKIRGKVITGKMKKDVLAQIINEAYQRYQDSLRQRGLDNIVTTQAFDLYRWLIDVERQFN